MQFASMNITALERAVALLAGPEASSVIAKTYQALESAMHDAYNEGFKHGEDFTRDEATQGVEKRLDEAFDEGFEQGVAFADLDTPTFNDGYLDGVEDAFRNPRFAEEEVQRIVLESAAKYYDLEQTFDYDLVRDSGDEQVQDEA